MDQPRFQLIGRRADRPQSLIFRDVKGRHFLRTACGSRLVRVTTRDANRIMRQYLYTSVLDSSWRSEIEAAGLDCPLPAELFASEAQPE